MKRKVKKLFPEAFCCKLNSELPGGLAWVVWPARCQPRGFERASIGYGKTPAQAWADAWKSNKPK